MTAHPAVTRPSARPARGPTALADRPPPPIPASTTVTVVARVGLDRAVAAGHGQGTP